MGCKRELNDTQWLRRMETATSLFQRDKQDGLEYEILSHRLLRSFITIVPLITAFLLRERIETYFEGGGGGGGSGGGRKPWCLSRILFLLSTLLSTLPLCERKHGNTWRRESSRAKQNRRKGGSARQFRRIAAAAVDFLRRQILLRPTFKQDLTNFQIV